MLKKFLFAAGALLAVTITAAPPALASTHRVYRGHRAAAFHPGAHSGRYRSAAHVRSYSGARRIAGRSRLSRRRLVLAAQHSYGRHHRRFAAIRRDDMIRRYVGPSSSYVRASTPTGGAQVGGASYYGGRSHTASGGFVGAATCAHRSLPFGTRVLVTNLANSRQAVLTVNDRGPFVRGRIVDVSVGAAGTLGMLHSGTARVSVQVVGGPG